MKISLKLKIILGIAVFLAFIFAGFFYLMMMGINNDIKSHDKDAVAQSKMAYDSLMDEETRMLKMGLANMLENEKVKDIFLEKDRQKLYEFVKPLFDKQKDELGVTHWLFHEPDGNVFLRVHSPEIFGMPSLEKITLAKAEETQSWGVGMELGLAGFALRVVHPYCKDGRLIGYMEYGEDIAPFLDRMKKQTGNNTAMMAKKSGIDAGQWRIFRESRGLRNNYDDMQNFVMLGATDEELVGAKSNCFTEQMLENVSADGNIFNEFNLGGKNYQCGGFAMIDANGKAAGAVVEIRDTAAETTATNKTKYILLAVSIFSIPMLSFIIMIIVDKIIILPLKKLITGANEIKGGNLEKVITVDSRDEIGQLGTAFNEMTARIKESYSGLEKKVVEKTAELSKILKEMSVKNKTLEDSQKAILEILKDLEESNKAIEEEKARYKAERDRGEGILRYLHAIGEGVVAVDCGGRMNFINLTAAKMISRAEGSPLIGKKYANEFTFVVGRGDDKKKISPVEEVFKIAGVYDFPQNCYLIAGSKNIPVSGSFAPIIKNGKVLGVVGVFQDITERYKIDKEKDDFLSIAAHQLRTPLTGVRWTIESLLDGDAGKLPEKANGYLNQIFENNQRLITLVNDLLDVSRINMGKAKEEAVPVNVCKTINEVVRTMDGLAKERGVAVSFEKVCALNPEVKTYPKYLFQALENLVSNAIKYTPKGGSVIIAVNFKKDTVLISVADTGIGIPKKDQEKIFSKFFRASNAVLKETEGSGLGLNVVKSFIEESGGRVSFESREGKGTTFLITFPVYKT